MKTMTTNRAFHTRASTSTSLRLSTRLYEMLLALYPADYRAGFGSQMVQVFRDIARDSYLQAGAVGVMRWSLASLGDLIVTAFAERRRKPVSITRRGLGRTGGALWMAAGVFIAIAGISALQPGLHYSLYGIYELASQMVFPAMLMLALGAVGIALRYFKRAPLVGRLAMLVMSISGIAIPALLILLAVNEALWNLMMHAMVTFFASILLFGLVTSHTRLLPSRNRIPTAAGGLFFVQLLFQRANGSTAYGPYGPQWEEFIVWVLIGGCFFLIGRAAALDRSS